MNPQELQEWLLDHASDIPQFTDYEIACSSEADLHDYLEQYWFRDPLWNEPGYRFVPLGGDGSGGEVAVWIGPSAFSTLPVVFFGSEGGSGVLVASPTAFAQALAYAPLLQEYQKENLDAPPRLSFEDNWFLSSEHADQSAAASSALARYRRAVESRFGALPSAQSLVTVPPAMQTEFRGWVTSVQSRVSKRDAHENQLAAERKRQGMRDKAFGYAMRSADVLPADAASLLDGSKFIGRCAACNESTALRLTKFEELVFGLCVPCYFSSAW